MCIRERANTANPAALADTELVTLGSNSGAIMKNGPAEMIANMNRAYADAYTGPLLRAADASRATRMAVEATDRGKAIQMLGEIFGN